VEERSSRTVDQRGGLFQIKVAHVAKVEIQFYACLGGTYPRLLKHRWRRVDSDDAATSLACNRDGDTTVPDRKLDEQTVGFCGEPDVERHVFGNMGRPVRIPDCERLRPTHLSTLWPPTRPTPNCATSN